MSANPKALIIDHNDSFTYNLRSWLSYGFDVEILNYSKIKSCIFEFQDQKKFDLIVLSAGPKSAKDYPESIELLKKISPVQPVLGICLGLQMMCVSEKGTLEVYSPPLHGKTSLLQTKGETPFSIFNNTAVARYHSMHCQLNDSFETLAVAEDNAGPIVMAAKHKHKKWLGFQFHPESFLTEKSSELSRYLLAWMNE